MYKESSGPARLMGTLASADRSRAHVEIAVETDPLLQSTGSSLIQDQTEQVFI
jgi:hypothetical protein